MPILHFILSPKCCRFSHWLWVSSDTSRTSFVGHCGYLSFNSIHATVKLCLLIRALFSILLYIYIYSKSTVSFSSSDNICSLSIKEYVFNFPRGQFLTSRVIGNNRTINAGLLSPFYIIRYQHYPSYCFSCWWERIDSISKITVMYKWVYLWHFFNQKHKMLSGPRDFPVWYFLHHIFFYLNVKKIILHKNCITLLLHLPFLF